MEHATSSSERIERSERISLSRLWWVGPLVVAMSVVANAVFREIAVVLFAVSPAFHNLRWIHFITFTVVAVSAAVVVFAVVARYSHRPIHLYRQIAVVVLVLSFIPNIAMFFGNAPGQTPAAILTLMSMHVVDAAICIGLLPSLTSINKYQ